MDQISDVDVVVVHPGSQIQNCRLERESKAQRVMKLKKMYAEKARFPISMH